MSNGTVGPSCGEVEVETDCPQESDILKQTIYYDDVEEDTSVYGRGNQGPQCTMWQVVFWKVDKDGNETNTWKSQLAAFLKQDAVYKCYAEHIGERNQRPHIHCYIRLHEKKRATQIFKMFNTRFCKGGLKGTELQNKTYIRDQNPDSFHEYGILNDTAKEYRNCDAELLHRIKNGESLKRIAAENKIMMGAIRRNWKVANLLQSLVQRENTIQLYKKRKLEYTLSPWEEKCVKMIEEEVHPRHILWFYDEQGDHRMSAFVDNYLLGLDGAMKVNICRQFQSVMYDICEQADGHFPRIIVIDVPVEGFKRFKWEAIETLKNGNASHTKYKGEEIIGDRPHILVFSNSNAISSPLTGDEIRQFTVRDNDIIDELII